MEKRNLKGKIFIAIAAVILVVMSAAIFMKNGVLNVFRNNNVEPYELQAGNFDLKSDDLVKASAQLLGMPYGWDVKGVKLNKSIYSNTITAADLRSVEDLRQTGVDCSGLIYYVLTSLNCSTVGFDKQNPVPYNTYHWYNHFLTSRNSTLQIKVGNGSYKNVKVLKSGEDITNNIRYYQDANGNTLPAGTIIISQNPSGNYENDHSWIYLGEFDNKDEVINYLKNDLGISETLLNSRLPNGHDVVEALGGNCKHWRIEAAANVGVRINNIDPGAGTNDSGKTIGKIYAFQIADEVEVTGKYKINVIKQTSDGTKLNGAKFNATKAVFEKGETLKTAESFITANTTGNNGTFAKEFNINNTANQDVIEITEVNAPNGYEKLNKKIVLRVIFKKDGSKYLIDKVNVNTLDKTTTVTREILNNSEASLTNSNPRYTYTDNEGNKYIIELTNNNTSINVKVENKRVDLALKKMITKVNGTRVELANGFNTSRHNENGEGWKINAEDLANKKSTNAIYTMSKTPVEVAVGDEVEYSIRIYNEGEIKAKAKSINDYIPEGLTVLSVKYDDTTIDNPTVENGVLSIDLSNADFITPFIGRADAVPSYYNVTVTCKVNEGAKGVLTNVAEIMQYETENGIIGTDIDSTSGNWNSPRKNGELTDKLTVAKDYDGWKNYANGKQTNVNNGGWYNDYLAQDSGVNQNKGDDDDFDKVVVKGTYNIEINKIDEDTNEGINDIKFNVQAIAYGEEKLNLTDVELTDAKFTDSGDISTTIQNGIIKYTITEVQNNNYVQITEPITIELETAQGKLLGYRLYHDNKVITANIVKEAEKTFELISNDRNFSVKINFTESNVSIEIPNKKINPSSYGLVLRKVSSTENQAPLNGVDFEINGENYTTNDQGYTSKLTSNITVDNYNQVDEYVIKEGETLEGFTKLQDDIIVKAYKKNEKGILSVDRFEVSLGSKTVIVDDNLEKTIEIVDINGIRYPLKAFIQNDGVNGPVLTIIVPNAPNKTVPLLIRKTNFDALMGEDDTIIGTEFSVYRGEEEMPWTTFTDTTGATKLEDVVEAGNRTLTYRIVEEHAAEGFDNKFAGKYIKIVVNVEDGIPVEVVSSEVYNRDGTRDISSEGFVTARIADVDRKTVVDIEIENEEIAKKIDLALKKIITEVSYNGTALTPVNGNVVDSKYDRITQNNNDLIDINVDNLINHPWEHNKNDAVYNMNKTPIPVLKGSTVKYQIRIYNEGNELDATASEIKDYLPNGMTVKNVYYRDNTPLESGVDYVYDANKNVLKITALKDKMISKFDGETLSMDYVTVECQVGTSDALVHTGNRLLTNMAEITKYQAYNGGYYEDRKEDFDSNSGNWKNPVNLNTADNDDVNRDLSFWKNYIGVFMGERVNTYEEGVFKNYLGQEDDDDFEKVEVVEIDLVLKKVITKVGNTEEANFGAEFKRFQEGNINYDVSGMNRTYDVTTGKYYLNKTPILASVGDEVKYQIRIYNEGSIDATASEIKDYIPKGLDLVSVEDSEGNVLTQGNDYTISNNVLKITALKGKLIEKYKGTNINLLEPSYTYVTVTCRINGQVYGLLTNVAEISKYETRYGETTEDRDSQTTGNGEWQEPTGSNKNTVDGKSGQEWSTYYDTVEQGEFLDYELQQDDDDFEKIIVKAYNVKLLKYSQNPEKQGIASGTIKVNGVTYNVDSNGYIDLGWYDYINAEATENEYVISEINVDGYAEIDGEIKVIIKKGQDALGNTVLKGFEVYKDDSRLSQYGFNKNEVGRSTSYIKDKQGNQVAFGVNVQKDTTNVGAFSISFELENAPEKTPYEINIVKEDSVTHRLMDGTKFNVSSIDENILKSDGTYFGSENIIETDENGIGYVGSFLINDRTDIFEISEIETSLYYIALDSNITLIVNKKAVTNNNGNVIGYEVENIQLKSVDGTSEVGDEVTLSGVKLKEGRKTVDVIAKLTEREDESTGEIIPVINITIPNIGKKFDLSLRKHIIQVNKDAINRWSSPEVDATELANGNSTTATYNNAKDPVEVYVKDTVLYGLRVYNEGEIGGFAEIVIDDVPEGLEMIAPGDGEDNTSVLNSEYRWKMYRKVKNNETVNVEDVFVHDGVTYVLLDNDEAADADIIVTDYLSKAVGEEKYGFGAENKNYIPAFDPETMNEPDSREILVEFKVKVTNEEGDHIINKAQIAKDADEDGNEIEDRDSDPSKWENPPRDDDQDYEELVVLRNKEFDLSLRKFITKVNDKELDKSREPDVDAKKLASGDSTTAKYTHPKEESPVLVNPNDIVEYTIRVYNEGEVDGYANFIMDDVPEGVEMIAPDYTPDGKANNVNAEYGWVMFRKASENEDVENKVTYTYDGDLYVIENDPTKAEVIATDYLSFENGEEAKASAEQENPNLLKAFNPEVGKFTEDNYRDVKVQFRVKKEKADKLITNYAQIAEDLDKDGNPVEDRDSTPSKWEESPRNDDQDYDVIKVGYFDLALYKWVSTAIVTEDGKTTEYASEHTQEDKSNVVNVSIPKDKLNKVTVKFKYQIKVENEGTVAGYAKEVKDHIPSGLKFVAEDNTEFGWILQEDGTITTDYLKDTLLNPRESAEVTVVLTWINGSENFGKKVNTAEISKDENEYGWPDIDSTPDNLKETPVEDDEDKDEVLLQIRTGALAIAYIVIGLAAMVIVAGGAFGIKKFVKNK